MKILEEFSQIAPYLKNPLVLAGLALCLFYWVHYLLIKSGLIKPISQAESGLVVRLLLRYGLWVAILVIVGGFSLTAWQNYIKASNISARRQANVAVSEIKKEILQNFQSLSFAVGMFDAARPEPFYDKRKVNETEQAYQERAKNYFRDYIQSNAQILQNTEYTTEVYRSFHHDFARADAEIRGRLEKAYYWLQSADGLLKRFVSRLADILGNSASDTERYGRSSVEHAEKILAAKMDLCIAAQQFCLAISDDIEIDALTKALSLANIRLPLQKGEKGCEIASRQAGVYAQERARVMSGQAGVSAQRDNQRRVSDPYLRRLRAMAGLQEDLTEAELAKLQKKALDPTQDPAALFKLAALSYLESDGEAALAYFERALNAETLSPLQRLFARLSLDRLRNPEKYEESLGVMVFKVDPNGGFKAAGVQPGDVLLSIDGIPLDEPADISAAFGKSNKELFVFRILRDNQTAKIVVMSGQAPGAIVSQLVILNTVQI